MDLFFLFVIIYLAGFATVDVFINNKTSAVAWFLVGLNWVVVCMALRFL